MLFCVFTRFTLFPLLKNGSTALTLAVSRVPSYSFTSADKEKVALILIEAGADTSLSDNQGRTALEQWNEYKSDSTLRHRVSLAERLFDRRRKIAPLAFFACGFEISFGLGCCQPSALPQNTASTADPAPLVGGGGGGSVAVASGRRSAELLSKAFSHAHGGMNLRCMAGYL